MTYSEADTRAKLIDPALYQRGWTEDLIRREESAGLIVSPDDRMRTRRGRTDYTLRVKVNAVTQPVAVALIEAKSESLPPTHGLEQAKLYADAKRLNVPFVFSTNGHLFVAYDRFTGVTSHPLPIAAFPTPDQLRAQYEARLGLQLTDEAARPLLTRYKGGEASRRYYQDAAIRAAFEKLARGEKRVLLSLATGAGKTFIAANLLWRIAGAGMLRRALFLCDRDELRRQAYGALRDMFGSNAAIVTSQDAQKNARILVATYQTLGLDADGDASFLRANYPEDFFSHIVIDECHRSAWGKWSEVLKRNANAVQIGLTATPRHLVELANQLRNSPETLDDAQISADNYRYFGEPVYEYDMAQGIEDGYLAVCEVIQRDVLLGGKDAPERETGLSRQDLEDKELRNPNTGQHIGVQEARERYEAASFERDLILPDRVAAMCADLFTQMLRAGDPEQKTIIFCASDRHADVVAVEMNNLYAAWCQSTGRSRMDRFAFKCTAASSGNDEVPNFRGSPRSHFIATTVDLLSTGVDIPAVRNVAFFRYVRSPIAFYQMVGRGTRLDPATNKRSFRVFDYTDATRLFGQSFISRISPPQARDALPRPDERYDFDAPGPQPIEVQGIPVQVTDAGKLIVTRDLNGSIAAVPVEDYRAMVSAKLVATAKSLDDFRARWIAPAERGRLLNDLPDGNRSAALVRELDDMLAYDVYDVLAELGYGQAARTRDERVASFDYKQGSWLKSLPLNTTEVLKAILNVFTQNGTEALENPHIFDVPRVRQAGGVQALQLAGDPAQLVQEAKERLFAAAGDDETSSAQSRSTKANGVADNAALLDQLEAAVRGQDGVAYTAALEAVDVARFAAQDWLRTVVAAASAGDVLRARELSNRGAAAFPEDAKLKNFAHVLAPPRVVAKTPADPRRTASREANYQWWKANRHNPDYYAKWVALKDGQVIQHGQSWGDVHDRLPGGPDPYTEIMQVL